MSHSVLIQDWVTMAAQVASAVSIQNEGSWVECSGYQDACFYLEVANASAAATGNLYVQTSPTRDSNFFDASGNASVPGSIANFTLASGTLGVQALKISRWATEANQPLAKYLRWKIIFGTVGFPYSVTFRLWATLNQAGY